MGSFTRFVAPLLFVAVLASGCLSDVDHRPEAIGEEGRVTVVMDTNQWNGPIGEAVRGQLMAAINTLPAPEPSFDLRNTHIRSQSQFAELQKQKNLVFVAPLADSTQEGRFINSVFSPDAKQAIRDGTSAIVGRRNVWRRNQQVFYVTAPDANHLADAIRTDGMALRDSFNVVTRERLHREMFERGRQRELEDAMLQNHGFAVHAQHDYLVATDTTDFFWLRRILPDTWRSLFVHYIENGDPSAITPDWIYAQRDSLAQIYLQGNLGGWIAIDYRRPLETKQVSFLGRYAFETRGLWIMIDGYTDDGRPIVAGSGGPFLTYTFYDQNSGRVYFVDGMVFAPGFEKREFLRQMEVIAHTFRTREDVSTSLASR